MPDNDAYLIVGLGNLGRKYSSTRHNIGFLILEKLASEYNGLFTKKDKLNGELALININGKKIFLLKPSTFMNLSGEAIRKAIDFYKLNKSNMLVISDDVYVNYGEFRFKDNSSSGGHKGLEDIEKKLKTKNYLKLKVGVGPKPDFIDLADFVLNNFTEKEKQLLPSILDAALKLIHIWLKQDVQDAKSQAKKIRKQENNKGTYDEKR